MSRPEFLNTVTIGQTKQKYRDNVKALDNILLLVSTGILEEAKEVSDFENGEDPLSWEGADLTYFVLALMAQNNVKIENVLGELASRTK